jgi:hypothetical protein
MRARTAGVMSFKLGGAASAGPAEGRSKARQADGNDMMRDMGAAP